MSNLKEASPLKIAISFQKLFDKYEDIKDSKNPVVAEHASRLLTIAKKHPKLLTGIDDPSEIESYQPEIDVLLQDFFNPVLQENEIKFATLPYQEIILKSSLRYKNILKNAPDDFELHLMNFDDHHFYIMGCSMILRFYYGYTLDFRRPFYYKIPDANGVERSYRIFYNADYVTIEKTDEALEITEEDVADLLDNFDNIDVWKEKFLPHTWIFKGFVIANLVDVTSDAAISEFKTLLLRQNNDDGLLSDEIQTIFQTIFNVQELDVGFSDFNEEDDTLDSLMYKQIKSFILHGEKSKKCEEALCGASYYKLFKQNEYYCISNVSRYHKLHPNNVLYKKLKDQGIQSAILAAIMDGDKVLGVLEIVSALPDKLNSINANKLKDMMPFLAQAVVRAKAEKENELELIIQEECTSIHNSVHWKFRKEAKRYLAAMANNNPTFFREIVFEDVYPLYGQMDIKGSSEARNKATVQDLKLQLETIKTIITRIYNVEKLPIYDQINYRISEYLTGLGEELQVDSERQVLSFLQAEIIPLFKHLSKKNEELAVLISDYYKTVEETTGLIYKHRKDYDDTVMLINKKMASVLDKKQVEAQTMYPHYYERYKTDGVEHNLYIGESITKRNSFHKVYLYNLRLWQLQAMWEMENSYYKLKKEHLKVELDVASMILVFNDSLSLRFRMDEKRFDVDGTYNARYEVVKKRVDKSLVKGTNERVTQPGKLTIIYSQDEAEQEYRKYISFLQTKNQLDANIEVLQIEDLQGVTGLKALRVSVLYTHGKENKEYYTYADLMEHISG